MSDRSHSLAPKKEIRMLINRRRDHLTGLHVTRVQDKPIGETGFAILQINSYRFRLAPWTFCLFGCMIANTSLQ